MTDRSQNPIPTAWVGVDEIDTLFTNVFVTQVSHSGDFILTFGELIQPMLSGTREEQLDQLSRMPFVPIRPVARLALSEKRLAELGQVIESMLKQYRDQQEKP